jgi:hypothetical protein
VLVHSLDEERVAREREEMKRQRRGYGDVKFGVALF